MAENQKIYELLRSINNYLEQLSGSVASEPTTKEALTDLHEKFDILNRQLNELNNYAIDLANGNLNVDFLPRNNFLAAGLKELHSKLLHITWKVERIACGDYGQKIDFLGELSHSFNKMTEMIQTREKHLQQNKDIFNLILSNSDISVFVLEKADGKLLYRKISGCTPDGADLVQLEKRIYDALLSGRGSNGTEWEFYCETDKKWFNVKRQETNWSDTDEADFFLLTDVSEKYALSEKLRQTLQKDISTGVYNKKFAMETVQTFIDAKRPFSACFCDIDYLKQTNDIYGHKEGDKLISSFMAIVQKAIRSNDYLCRMGGDEFLILLPDCGAAAAEAILRRILEDAKRINSSKANPFILDFSYGIETVAAYTEETDAVFFPPDGEELTPAEHIINRADQKMYLQKAEKKKSRSAQE